MSDSKPTLRWGILSTGMIASWFVTDLLLPRPDAKATHVLQAIGTSSLEKGRAFAAEHLPSTLSPSIYGSYEELYADPAVDIIYIGTPHAFHKRNCLDAIAAGKHVLCEKPFTLLASEAREVAEAARQRGVFVMEAMWTRFFPAVLALQEVVHRDRVIGDVQRVFADFSLEQDIAGRPAGHRLKDPALGAGSLLDIGVYAVTWGLLGLDTPPTEGAEREKPKVLAAQSLSDGVDVATSIILLFDNGRQGIITSHSNYITAENFCRIEGTEGTIYVNGPAAPIPSSFTIKKKGGEEKTYSFEKPCGRGFYYEADAVALDIAAGKKQSSLIPLSETVRVMEILDEARRQGGARFPQDDF
jgi:predicted dehydrogenase